MSTVPQERREVPAADVRPGQHVADGKVDGLLAEVTHVQPYAERDHRACVALMVRPLLHPEPVVLYRTADYPIRLATDAEIEEHRDGGRRRELAAALVDLAERIERDRLPVPYQNFRVIVRDRTGLARWAASYGLTMPDVTPGEIPCIEAKGSPVRIFAQCEADPQTSTGDTSPSVAGAAGVTAPSGPEGRDSGPDTPTAPAVPMADCTEPATQRIRAYYEQTDGTHGAVYTCDTHRGEAIAALLAIGLRGRTQGTVSGEPCGHQVNHVVLGAPVLGAPVETAAGDGTPAPADGADDDSGADEIGSRPLATGGSPADVHAAPARPGPVEGSPGPGRVTPSYDPMPTCIYAPGSEDRIEFHAKYASDLDESNPGWHWHDTTRMSPELAREAEARRGADTTERPYRCEGCGKTSRIVAHYPGCAVDAAWLARQQSGADE